MDRRYPINIFWSPRDECWVADVPDLKSCSAFGDTPEEAAAEVQIAIEAWVEAAVANGMEIPEAHDRPSIEARRAA